MTRQEVVERLQEAIGAGQWAAGAAFGGASGFSGSVNVLQSDMNKAMDTWQQRGDAEGIRQVADTLHVIGNLNDTDYEQIMNAVNGEK